MRERIFQPIIKPLIHPIKALSESGKLGGVLLIIATSFSIILTNSSYGEQYLHFWHQEIGFPFLSMHAEHWVNDLFMAVFFFLVGMEIKRELIIGELASIKKALLPLFGALGGMALPALLFFAFNARTENSHGWAIPTATDIAFSLGILSLLGKRVPLSLKVFLTALAVIDDLGGILIIALFYTQQIHVQYLLAAIAVIGVLYLLNRLKVSAFIWYCIPIVTLWYCVYQSGVHATIAGVLAALFIPIEKVEQYEHILHKPVNYGILPVFALANTTILLSPEAFLSIGSNLSLGIILALVLGKSIGIFSLAYASIKTRVCSLPEDIHLKQIFGVSILAGIGFTMSLFFTALSFKHPESANIARLAILLGSGLSAICGWIFLYLTLKKSSNP